MRRTVNQYYFNSTKSFITVYDNGTVNVWHNGNGVLTTHKSVKAAVYYMYHIARYRTHEQSRG